MSELLKTRGLIVREIPFGDSGKIFTMITEDYGKIDAVAKGARSSKSRLFPACNLFCYSSFVLYRGRNMYSIREASLETNFFDLRKSMERLSYAAYFAELVSEVCPSELPDEGQLRLILNTLYLLCGDKVSPQKLKALFELRLALIMGVAPQLDYCRLCGGRKDLELFDFKNSGVLCKKCGAQFPVGFFHINETVRSAVHYIVNSPLKDIFFFEMGEADSEMLYFLAEKYIGVHVNKGLKSLDYLKRVGNSRTHQLPLPPQS